MTARRDLRRERCPSGDTLPTFAVELPATSRAETAGAWVDPATTPAAINAAVTRISLDFIRFSGSGWMARLKHQQQHRGTDFKENCRITQV
jgi:hypothetical protein